MSTTKRIISGSLASWFKIGITVLAQLILVPVYLAYWDVETYGIWITIQALITIISILNQGHQTFLEFRFLKHGSANRDRISFDLWSGLLMGLLIGFFEILMVVLFIRLGMVGKLLGIVSIDSPRLIYAAGIVLFIQISLWSTFTSLTGLFTRALAPFGYYPRMSWWGVWNALVTTFVPVVAVTMGADLLNAGIILACVVIACSIPQWLDIYRLNSKIGLHYQLPSLRNGFANFIKSMVLSAKSLLENLRQQGVRVILSPLVGPILLVAFSTMRTAANISLQGLNTITNPLMPELMRFLNNRDQAKTEASFSTVWLIVLVILIPGFIVLQYFIEPLYTLWIKGRVSFNPLLFAQLSFGVLIYAIAQPAMAVIRGNNLLRPQLLISILAALTAVGGIFALVPVFGITGAGTSLLVSELVATTGYRIVARNWLRQNGLAWPARSANIVMITLLVSGLVMLGLIYIPQGRALVLAAGLVVVGLLIRVYWLSLPSLLSERVQRLKLRFGALLKRTSFI